MRKTRTTHVFWLEPHGADTLRMNPPTFPLSQWRTADLTILTAARPRPILTDFRLWPGLNLAATLRRERKTPSKERAYFYSAQAPRQQFFPPPSSRHNKPLLHLSSTAGGGKFLSPPRRMFSDKNALICRTLPQKCPPTCVRRIFFLSQRDIIKLYKAPASHFNIGPLRAL